MGPAPLTPFSNAPPPPPAGGGGARVGGAAHHRSDGSKARHYDSF